jgi:hypothetical protein
VQCSLPSVTICSASDGLIKLGEKEKKKKKGYLDFIFKAPLVSPMVTSNQQKMSKILFYQLY